VPGRRSFIVTGGAGFIGANLAARLAAREPDARLCILDPFRSGSFANITEAFARAGPRPFTGEVIADTSSHADWPWLIERLQPAAVFHLGAITDTTASDERLMLQENCSNFPEMIDACAQARVPLVYASSAATYGTPPQAAEHAPFPESAAGRPSNVYGFSKWLMEQEHARSGATHPRAHIVGLRYFNVFGPGEARKGPMASMVLQLARQLLSGTPARLFRPGDQARDQVYVDDVVACTMHASGLFGGSPRPGVYNLGSGVATPFNAVVDAVREALDIPQARQATEYFDMPAHVRAFYQDFTQADMTLAAEGLGWRPEWEPARAMRVYARWLREGRPDQRAG
jgi:ADP-L-glycero-D-manno-heptose 6-epimerase